MNCESLCKGCFETCPNYRRKMLEKEVEELKEQNKRLQRALEIMIDYSESTEAHKKFNEFWEEGA